MGQCTFPPMKSFYPSYIRAFKNFAQSSFDNGSCFQTMSQFAVLIRDQASELIKRAALNLPNDLTKLEKEMIHIVNVYVHKYADMERKSRKAIKNQEFSFSRKFPQKYCWLRNNSQMQTYSKVTND